MRVLPQVRNLIRKLGGKPPKDMLPGYRVASEHCPISNTVKHGVLAGLPIGFGFDVHASTSQSMGYVRVFHQGRMVGYYNWKPTPHTSRFVTDFDQSEYPSLIAPPSEAFAPPREDI